MRRRPAAEPEPELMDEDEQEALVAELDAVFREFAFALPGSSVTELKVTEDLVSKPEEELRRLLAV